MDWAEAGHILRLQACAAVLLASAAWCCLPPLLRCPPGLRTTPPHCLLCTVLAAAELGLSIGILIVGVPSLLLLLARRDVPTLFTTDAAVVQACSALMLPLATLLVSEWLSVLEEGMHGCGWQELMAWELLLAARGGGLQWPVWAFPVPWAGHTCGGQSQEGPGRASCHHHHHPTPPRPSLDPPSPPPAANGATALLSGILRGCGRQRVGAAVNAVANYAAGLPLMLLLAFWLRAGVAGLWWGIAGAAALQAAVMAALVSRFDWRREAARAARLVRHLSAASMAGSRPASAATEAPPREDAGGEDDRPPATLPPLL